MSKMNQTSRNSVVLQQVFFVQIKALRRLGARDWDLLSEDIDEDQFENEDKSSDVDLSIPRGWRVEQAQAIGGVEILKIFNSSGRLVATQDRESYALQIFDNRARNVHQTR